MCKGSVNFCDGQPSHGGIIKRVQQRIDRIVPVRRRWQSTWLNEWIDPRRIADPRYCGEERVIFAATKSEVASETPRRRIVRERRIQGTRIVVNL
jgi:hypothetical protein